MRSFIKSTTIRALVVVAALALGGYTLHDLCSTSETSTTPTRIQPPETSATFRLQPPSVLLHEAAARNPLTVTPRTTVEELLELVTRSDDAWTRAEAIEELAERREHQALPHLLRRLQDADGDVRRVAAEALSELGDSSIVPILASALASESNERTRSAMAEALADLQ
jgi:HEAT repeat protein